MFVENYRKVRSEIDDACRRVGRQPSEVRLLPVSKTVPVDALVESWPELAAAGCAGLAENRVQEAVAKAEAFREAFGDKAPHMAIIGPLQTNKAGHLVSCADEFQALDRPKVAGALQRHLADSERTLDVLIQVNASREPQKSGLAPSHAAEFVRMFGPDGEYPNLRLRGFMTIAAQNDPNVRETFAELRELRDSLLGDLPEGVSLDELSMGMSGDYREAIAEGATTVRVGRAIFGERSYQK
ncbi:YggS family pyridoxal phosphate-dependent enzyme [Corynebacterium amycolatum]|uniref:YggS family pyridoxal phosphate-dependent enzyme n=1 Tax=Corynebacterium amycolatum TaxID=43765 RepID=UPI0012462349|nr:YggS family pyridoxal phosphate-dependent enzyme [Corynebacterium amycolatum]KAA9225002.1 YggS family pyridoxal phosphate-dependent enzyme [Corynebacterium amycolatum]